MCRLKQKRNALFVLLVGSILAAFICSEYFILNTTASVPRGLWLKLDTLPKKHRPDFRGGIEAKLLQSWHVELFRKVKSKQIFFAYDTPDDLPPLEHAAMLFRDVGYGNRNLLRCYVLIGYPGDSFDLATKRLETVKVLGFCPMAMLYRDFKGDTTSDWRRFQRSWARPTTIYSPYWHDPLLP